jgi:hypothetical protein
MISRFLHDKSANVRWHLLTHHRERRDIAEVLSHDTDDFNARQALAQLYPNVNDWPRHPGRD